MLLSMTGFGNAALQTDAAYVAVELKSVNNRYLKVSMRIPEYLAAFEPEIEKLLRSEIARGAIQLTVRIRLSAESSGYSIDQGVLERYVSQTATVVMLLEGNITPPSLGDFLSLPGVVTETEVTPDAARSVWPAVEAALREALVQFHEFRRTEGASMKQDLLAQCRQIENQLQQVATFAPDVVKEYRQKLLERVQKALEGTESHVSESDVIRDVAIFADKCDINEEITRLRSHLEQFREFLESSTSMGRKLEFLSQEMFREINTIGSKANDVRIARCVVEMKSAIDRIREILQNAE